jgi:hypothetical protein
MASKELVEYFNLAPNANLNVPITKIETRPRRVAGFKNANIVTVEDFLTYVLKPDPKRVLNSVSPKVRRELIADIKERFGAPIDTVDPRDVFPISEVDLEGEFPVFPK